MKPLELKNGSKARDYDPTISLRDAKFIRKAMLQAFEEGDIDSMVEIFNAHLRVIKRLNVADTLGISRQAVHKIFKKSSKPSLKTMTAFMKHLKDRVASAA